VAQGTSGLATQGFLVPTAFVEGCGGGGDSASVLLQLRVELVVGVAITVVVTWAPSLGPQGMQTGARTPHCHHPIVFAPTPQQPGATWLPPSGGGHPTLVGSTSGGTPRSYS